MKGLSANDIPSFRLYGEAPESGLPDVIHVETFKDRSKLHDWEIRPHRHADLFQIMHFRTPDVGVTLDGHVFRTTAPAILFVPPLVVHGFRFLPEVAGTVTTVPRELLHDRSPPLTRGGKATLLTPDRQGFARIGGLIVDIEAEYRHHRNGRTQAILALLDLVLTWTERGLSGHHVEGSPAENRDPARDRVEAFQALVDQTYAAGLDLADYAERVGTSKSQLSRDCRRVTGRTPLQLLHDRIVKEARRKLVYTPWQISQISDALGFADIGYFSRFYRRRTGETPSRYRARMRARLEGHGR